MASSAARVFVRAAFQSSTTACLREHDFAQLVRAQQNRFWTDELMLDDLIILKCWPMDGSGG